jgi:hypothetical protein
MSHLSILAFGTLVLSSTSPSAAYLVDGKMEGQVCTNYYIFQRCRLVPLDAVEGEQGQPLVIRNRYETVSEYDSTSHTCWITLKRRSWFFGARGAVGQTFLTRTGDGKYQRAEPRFVVFPCRQVE